MKLEDGKYYVTRDGRKVGPIHWVGHGQECDWGSECGAISPDRWNTDGSYHLGEEHPYDLVAEYAQNEPETKQEEPTVSKWTTTKEVKSINTVTNSCLEGSLTTFSVEPIDPWSVRLVVGAVWEDRYCNYFDKEGLAELIEVLQEIHSAMEY